MRKRGRDRERKCLYFFFAISGKKSTTIFGKTNKY